MCGKITFLLLVLHLIFMFSKYMFRASYLLWGLQQFKWVFCTGFISFYQIEEIDCMLFSLQLKCHFSVGMHKLLIRMWMYCVRDRSSCCLKEWFLFCSSLQFGSCQSWAVENLRWQCTLFRTLDLGVKVWLIRGIVLVLALTFIMAANYLAKLLSNLPGINSILLCKCSFSAEIPT